MKLKNRLTGIAAAVAVSLPMLVPAAAMAAPKCIGLANGGGMICFTPLAGTEVAGIQVGDASGASLALDPSVEVAGVAFGPADLGIVRQCVFAADDPAIQTCAV